MSRTPETEAILHRYGENEITWSAMASRFASIERQRDQAIKDRDQARAMIREWVSIVQQVDPDVYRDTIEMSKTYLPESHE